MGSLFDLPPECGMSEVNTDPSGHYVYVYRDASGKVRYVGYGARLDRAVSRDRSDRVVEFLAQGKFRIEVAGPYVRRIREWLSKPR